MAQTVRRSAHEDAVRLQHAGFATLRHVPSEKNELFAALPPELRQKVYRSPAASAHERAEALEHGAFAGLLRNGVSTLDAVVRDHPFWRDRRARDDLVFVHVPSRAIRERVLRTASGNVLAEIGDALMLFLTKLAAIVGHVKREVSAASLAQLFSTNPSEPLPESSARLRDLVASLVICGHPGPTPVSEFDPDTQTSVDQLSTAMLFFCMSRALVPHMAGDVTGTTTTSVELEGFEAQESFLTPAREPETDQAALDLMARACGREGIPNGIFTLAPFLFLEGARIAAQAVARLGCPNGALDESSARRAGLPPHAAERRAALGLSGPADGRLSSTIQRNATWLAQLFDSLRSHAFPFFARCTELGLAPLGLAAPPRHAFWLTPMARADGIHTAVPFYRLEDRARVTAIHAHLGRLRHLLPYVQPYEHDLVICYRASLYIESARRLGELLRAAGVDALHDELFVPPGTDWKPLLQGAIGSARLVVMLMSLTDLGAGGLDDLKTLPVVKEVQWAGESRACLFVAGVSHLSVEGEAGAIFRSGIDIIRAVADSAYVRKDFPVLMVQSDDGLLPPAIVPLLARDVQEELAQTP
jgi:hypothetical protein